MTLQDLDLARQAHALTVAVGIARREESQIAAIGRRRQRRRDGEQGQQRQGATVKEGFALIVHAGFRLDNTHFNVST